jgi:hypothetical protein
MCVCPGRLPHADETREDLQLFLFIVFVCVARADCDWQMCGSNLSGKTTFVYAAPDFF